MPSSREIVNLADIESSFVETSVASTSNAGTLSTICLQDVEAKPVEWIWPGRIAKGKFTLIAGNPGLGKSQLTANIAATISTGGRWPVSGDRAPRGDVLIFSAEDDLADTIRPRLEAAGADLQRIHFADGIVIGFAADGTRSQRGFCLQSDITALGDRLTALRTVEAVIVDPISCYLGHTDSHKNADVRAVLAPITDLASRYGVGVIGVTHLSKATGTQALTRVMGSMAFVAAPRAAFLVAPDPKNPDRRLFLTLKNNIGSDTGGLAFSIEATDIQSAAGTIETSRIAWEPEAATETADEVLIALASNRRPTGGREEAKAWLIDTLRGGPVASKTLKVSAESAGLSWRTIERAAKDLRIVMAPERFRGGWTWSLPTDFATHFPTVRHENVAESSDRVD